MWWFLILVPSNTINQENKIVSYITWSPAISAWDCHLIHDNYFGTLSTAAMKCLHWSLFCQINLSENYRTNFPSAFGKRTSFQSAFFNEDEFSLGPVFIEPCSYRHSMPSYFCDAEWLPKIWSVTVLRELIADLNLIDVFHEICNNRQ